MALEATSESSAHPRLGLNQHEFGDPVAIVRDVQPGPGADLDDAPAGAAQERAPPAAHARDLAQPENGRTPGQESAATPQTAGSPGVRCLIGCLRSRSCRERTSGRMVRASLGAA